MAHTGCDLLLVDGSSNLLQTDGASHLLLTACVVTPPSAESGGGGAGTPQRFSRKWWDSHPKQPKRKKVVEYAQSVAQAFSKAQAKDAKRLAERTEVLERLIEQSSFNLAYLTETAERLRASAIKAAEAETSRLRKEQLAVAAEIAHQLEMEIRDEEEAELLLLLD